MRNFHAKMNAETQAAISLVRQKTGLAHPSDVLAIMARVTAEAVKQAELRGVNAPLEQSPLPVVEEENV